MSQVGLKSTEPHTDKTKRAVTEKATVSVFLFRPLSNISAVFIPVFEAERVQFVEVND